MSATGSINSFFIGLGQRLGLQDIAQDRLLVVKITAVALGIIAALAFVSGTFSMTTGGPLGFVVGSLLIGTAGILAAYSTLGIISAS